MLQRLVAVTLLVTAVAVCGDATVTPISSIDDSSLEYPQVVASAADVLSIRDLTNDAFLWALVEQVRNGRLAQQLNEALGRISAAAGTSGGVAVMRTLADLRAGGIRRPDVELDPDDELALDVFEIMLDHAEWVLTGSAGSDPTEPNETTSIERTNTSLLHEGL